MGEKALLFQSAYRRHERLIEMLNESYEKLGEGH